MSKQLEQVIDEYLNKLDGQILELPPATRTEIREELRQHLEALVAMHREPGHAVNSALRQFGDPVKIGRLLAQDYEEEKWDLSGLSMPMRIQKLREAAAELADQQAPVLKTLQYAQIGVLLFVSFTLDLGSSAGPILPLSAGSLDILRYILLATWFVLGMVACGIEVKDGRRKLRDSPTTLQNVIGRAGLAILVPYGFLAQGDHRNFHVLLWIMLAVTVKLGLRSPSKKARLLSGTGAVFGMAMGLILGVVNIILIPRLGSLHYQWILLGLLPITFFIGQWFWEGPQAVSLGNKKARGRLIVGALLLALSIGGIVTSVFR